MDSTKGTAQVIKITKSEENYDPSLPSYSSAVKNTVDNIEDTNVEKAFEGDENQERGNWSGKLDFILSCVGFAVGLGNVWRFPYKCYDNGGGAFLIPYTLMLALAGLPLFFMELSFGQFSSLGPITVWKVAPLFKGIGYCMVIISILVDVYYNVVIGWSFYFLFRSFTSVLPWSHCDNDWNTELCVPIGSLNSSHVRNVTEKFCDTLREMDPFANCTGPKFTTPSQEFWKRHVLNQTDGLHDLGTLNYQTSLCLLLAWVVIFLCLAKGVKSSGKVVYVTATFPYVVLVILLVRGCTLEGAREGIIFYLTPKWEYLLKAQTWSVAATQIFYSLGPAFGGLITMASYNKFNNNCYRDALIVAVLNCATSVFAGFVIFSLIGFMAVKMNKDPGEVVDQGPGLAFIVYPEGIAQMPISPLWAVLFFIMLLTLGIGSQFVMVENVISAITDEYPKLRTKKTWVTLGTCIVMFFLGLPICTQGGIYLFVLLENYAAGFSLLIVAFSECIVICWVYGYKNFAEDINMMLGFRPNIFWRVCWCFLTPAILLGIMVFSFVQYSPSVYNDYVFPAWGESLGWLMFTCSVMLIPGTMLYQYCQSVGFMQSCRRVLRQADDWGPALRKYRDLDDRYRETTDIELELSDKITESNGQVKVISSATANDKPEKAPVDGKAKGVTNDGFVCSERL